MKRKPQALRASTAYIRQAELVQLTLPLPEPKRHKTRKQRFEEHVDRSAGPLACHPWTGSAMQANGYGQFFDTSPQTGRKTMRSAHRVAYELHTGQTIPAGKMVLHSRVCTTPLCCNGRHLRMGQARENNLDTVAMGRAVGRKLKADQVREIVAKHEAGAKKHDLADAYGVNVVSIRNIFSGATYSKITGIPKGTKSPNHGRPRKLKVAA
jgi:hypothetical protein